MFMYISNDINKTIKKNTFYKLINSMEKCKRFMGNIKNDIEILNTLKNKINNTNNFPIYI